MNGSTSIIRGFGALGLASVLVAACTMGTGGPDPSTPAGWASAAECAGGPPNRAHQAPELEAMLPARVDERDLTRWSLVGRCWLLLALPEGTDLEGLLEAANGFDVSHLRYAVAGRSDVSEDPPYFIFAANWPDDPDEADLATLLLLGGAGFLDPYGARDLGDYALRTIAGKEVYVGQPALIRQDEHQRGRPYLYQAEGQLFVAITDQDAWAIEALSALP